MKGSHRKTFESIMKRPTPSNLEWRRIESLLLSLDAKLIEGAGSRVRFELNDVIATFHRPHPQKEAKSYQVKDVKEFLEKAGIKYGNDEL
jgi:hypothetical protein